jgi:hypothetical protein
MSFPGDRLLGVRPFVGSPQVRGLSPVQPVRLRPIRRPGRTRNGRIVEMLQTGDCLRRHRNDLNCRCRCTVDACGRRGAPKIRHTLTNSCTKCGQMPTNLWRADHLCVTLNPGSQRLSPTCHHFSPPKWATTPADAGTLPKLDEVQRSTPAIIYDHKGSRCQG